MKETGFLDLKYETFKTFKSLILVRLEFTSDWYQSKQKYGWKKYLAEWFYSGFQERMHPSSKYGCKFWNLSCLDFRIWLDLQRWHIFHFLLFFKLIKSQSFCLMQ